MVRVFSNGAFLKEVSSFVKAQLMDIPEDAYLYWPGTTAHNKSRPWYRKDLTPVLLADVPKEYLALNLILN